MEINSVYNYYDVLEVHPLCPQQDVTIAYEKIKATYSGENPGVYTMFSENEARELLQLVEEAYSVLGNKTLRSIYDEKIGQSKTQKVDLSYDAILAQSKAVFSESMIKKTSSPHSYKKDSSFEDELKSKKEWSGEDLKKAREYKNYSLDKLSEITKVSSYYIKAVEGMDPTNLPAPVFVRGYVNQIAKTLQLDEKIVCDSYMKKYKEQIERK